MKTYIEVLASFTPDGTILPREVIWSDGRRFAVDRVKDVRRAASLKAGGHGLRYKCMILGRERFLFLEDDGRWFVE